MTIFYTWFGEFVLFSNIFNISGVIYIFFDNIHGEHSCFFIDISWDANTIVVILFKGKIWLDTFSSFVVGNAWCNVFAPESSSNTIIFVLRKSAIIRVILSNQISSYNFYPAYSHAVGTGVVLWSCFRRNIYPYMYQCFDNLLYSKLPQASQTAL